LEIEKPRWNAGLEAVVGSLLDLVVELQVLWIVSVWELLYALLKFSEKD